MSIAQDHDKNLWIATYRNGVYRYDGKDLKHYPIVDGSKVVKQFTVYCNRAVTIWLGTHEDGAYRFDGTLFEMFEEYELFIPTTMYPQMTVNELAS